jgi:hypothetical protein
MLRLLVAILTVSAASGDPPPPSPTPSDSSRAPAATLDTPKPPLSDVCASGALPAVRVSSGRLSRVNILWRSNRKYRLGVCVAEATIDTSGRIARLRVLTPTDAAPALVSAIAGDVGAWAFRPAQQCGSPVETIATMSITHCPVAATELARRPTTR